MKKILFSAIAVLFAVVAFVACSSDNKVECTCEGCEGCENCADCATVTDCPDCPACAQACADCKDCKDCANCTECACQEGQQVEAELVDVEASKVVEEPNGTQEVENTVTMTPETVQE